MDNQEEAKLSVFDVVKLFFSGAFLIAGLFAFYFFSDFPLLYRVLGLVVVLVVILLLFFNTRLGRSLWAFFKESKQEVRKIVWPTRDETVKTTLLVFAMVFVVGIFLWLLDMLLFWGVRILTGQG